MPDPTLYETALWLIFVAKVLLAVGLLTGVIRAVCWCKRIGQAILDLREVVCREAADDEEAYALIE